MPDYKIRDLAYGRLFCGDCIDLHEFRSEIPDRPVDLIFGSPPYEDARTYGIDFNLQGQAWVDWLVERCKVFQGQCCGLTALVVAGKTRNYKWSATPALLLADLHRSGFNLRSPVFFHRVGIPGSGGPDWFRNDTEFVCCFNGSGRLPWSDNTAMGNAPKYAPGGRPSHRKKNGARLNQEAGEEREYQPPARANPGNVATLDRDETTEQQLAIVRDLLRLEGTDLQHHIVGGGLMGHKLAHENEAPFPESLAETFIRSFCPPGGMVLDPFAGSGTTLCVAQALGRRWVGVDVREDQLDVIERRLADPRYAFGSWLPS